MAWSDCAPAPPAIEAARGAKDENEGEYDDPIRATFLFTVVLASSAIAQTPLERGRYLVNGSLACGNCHTPKDDKGVPIVERELSGGLSFTTPAFNATGSNITPDRETGIGAWSDEAIKRAITHGIRPDNARLPAPLAAVMAANFFKALLPNDLDAIVVYLRSVQPVRNLVPDPVYKAPVHRDRFPDAETGFTAAQLRPGKARRLSGNHWPLYGMPFRLGERGFRLRKWAREGWKRNSAQR